VTVDMSEGHAANARTGKILNDFPCGAKRYDPRTGEGPTIWTRNGKALQYRMALPREWADLYGSWNLAFVSRYREFPYLFAKLLIPQVQEYTDEPGAYIYNRALALYIHLHFLYLTRADNAAQDVESIDWADKDLTHLWGQVNLASAKAYAAAVARARSHSRAGQ